MSKDTIYREDAIKAINLQARIPHDIASAHYANMAINAIRSVPSADRPRGEWIDEADKYDASFGIHDYRCSNCNSYADEYIGGHEWYTAGKPNFCPHCGAKMKGADNE